MSVGAGTPPGAQRGAGLLLQLPSFHAFAPGRSPGGQRLLVGIHTCEGPLVPTQVPSGHRGPAPFTQAFNPQMPRC